MPSQWQKLTGTYDFFKGKGEKIMGYDFLMDDIWEHTWKSYGKWDLEQKKECLKKAKQGVKRLVCDIKSLEKEGDGAAVTGYENALFVTDQLRTYLSLILPQESFDTLPITYDKRPIEISYQKDILRVQIPYICPREPIKRTEVEPLRRSFQRQLAAFDLLQKRGHPYESYVILEKYILEESYQNLRDLDRFTASFLIDPLVQMVAKDDNLNYMVKYIRTAKHQGKQRYTILYLATPQTYRKYQDLLEK